MCWQPQSHLYVILTATCKGKLFSHNLTQPEKLALLQERQFCFPMAGVGVSQFFRRGCATISCDGLVPGLLLTVGSERPDQEFFWDRMLRIRN